MGDKFEGKYRIPSARLQSWDYSREGAYFITICTKNRKHYFGKIENGKQVLSNCGVIADLMWYEIKSHAKNIELGEFVVMPNHIHGILILNENNVETRHALSDANVEETRHALSDANVEETRHTLSDTNVEETRHALSDANVEETRHALSDANVEETRHALSLPIEKNIGQQRFQNQGKNTISSIIGSYKSAVTKHCNRLGFEFGWQPRFYDHIIRDVQAFEYIQNYIANNLMNWDKDKFYDNK